MKQPDEDRWLEAALSALPEVTVPEDLRRRIAELPIRHPRQAALPWLSPFGASLWWSLCGALGIVCGLYLDLPTQTDDSSFEALGFDQDSALVADGSDDEEILTAAFASGLTEDFSESWDDAAGSDVEGAP